MRHDWTLICTEVDYQRPGMIGLGNVFSRLALSAIEPLPTLGGFVSLEPPFLLVSHWTAEFAGDHRVYPAVVQLLAPGGDTVIWNDRVAIDLRESSTFRLIYAMPSLEFMGYGTYEFQVFSDLYGTVGEWGRACLSVFAG